MSIPDRTHLIVPALLLAAGIAIAGFFVSKTIYNANVGINTAEVKGLAERRVDADRAFWRVQYTVTGDDVDRIAELYEQSKADQEQIIELLIASGFAEDEVVPGVVDYRRQQYRDEDQNLVDEQFVLTGSIEVETDKVQLVATARSGTQRAHCARRGRAQQFAGLLFHRAE